MAGPNGRRSQATLRPGNIDQANIDAQHEAIDQLREDGKNEEEVAFFMRKIYGKHYHHKPLPDVSTASPKPSPTTKQAPSRASSSPLTEASPLQSPTNPDVAARKPSPEDSDDSDDHQPPPAMPQPQYQTFGANPLTFDDPTVYEVREVTEDMTDEEKKEIYCVASFPRDDLADLIAGVPPDKDFSNAVKPNNQVQAHTFATYLDGYLRPLKEEDIGFLKERVSGSTFLIVAGLMN